MPLELVVEEAILLFVVALLSKGGTLNWETEEEVANANLVLVDRLLDEARLSDIRSMTAVLVLLNAKGSRFSFWEGSPSISSSSSESEPDSTGASMAFGSSMRLDNDSRISVRLVGFLPFFVRRRCGGGLGSASSEDLRLGGPMDVGWLSGTTCWELLSPWDWDCESVVSSCSAKSSRKSISSSLPRSSMARRKACLLGFSAILPIRSSAKRAFCILAN